MKPKSLIATLAGCAAIATAVLLPLESAGQAGASAEEVQLQQALAEVAAQQAIIAENQAKLDEKTAQIAEEVRVARIFAGRAGGGGKSK